MYFKKIITLSIGGLVGICSVNSTTIIPNQPEVQAVPQPSPAFSGDQHAILNAAMRNNTILTKVMNDFRRIHPGLGSSLDTVERELKQSVSENIGEFEPSLQLFRTAFRIGDTHKHELDELFKQIIVSLAMYETLRITYFRGFNTANFQRFLSRNVEPLKTLSKLAAYGNLTLITNKFLKAVNNGVADKINVQVYNGSEISTLFAHLYESVLNAHYNSPTHTNAFIAALKNMETTSQIDGNSIAVPQRLSPPTLPVFPAYGEEVTSPQNTKLGIEVHSSEEQNHKLSAPINQYAGQILQLQQENLHLKSSNAQLTQKNLRLENQVLEQIQTMQALEAALRKYKMGK